MRLLYLRERIYSLTMESGISNMWNPVTHTLGHFLRVVYVFLSWLPEQLPYDREFHSPASILEDAYDGEKEEAFMGI